MTDLFEWLTHLDNSKVLALVIFFTVFCLIVFYLYSNKSRSERLESYKNIPLQDDEMDRQAETDNKVSKDE